jgi:hypothetical protein
MLGDSIFMVQPEINNPAAPYNLSGGFPPGLLTIKVVNPEGGTANMRWTGLFNNDWHNPANWVNVKSNYEAPADWAPTHCVDVVISSGSTYYPELVDSAYCNNIRMTDRALLKNPHVLSYNNASVEIKLKPAERDRFVMWSAPLKSMYTGDYHYKKGTVPQWGDISINLFQHANPGLTIGAAAVPYAYTFTFGNVNEPLGIGKAFNLKVTTTSESRDKTFLFPQTDDSYTDNDTPAHSFTLSRTDRAKFITNDYHPVGLNGIFPMPIAATTSAMSLVQVVNPYLAYLDFSKFLAGNSGKIGNGYYIWNGDVNDGFTAINITGNRSTMSSPGTSTDPNFIPPLQSFIVAKLVDPLTTLNMSPGYTTTNSTPYVLRGASITKGGILQIKASQGNKTSYAALAYDPDASPDFGKEDMPVVILEEMPLTVYSITALHEPLSFNSSNDFISRYTDLGLRILQTGETTLTFSELETFGHNVTLVDKYLGNKEINLNKTPEYTFVSTKIGELNDRFTLRMQYTGQGIGVGNEPILTPAMNISSSDGYIHVSSNAGLISQLQVYSLVGTLLYSNNTPSDSYRVPVGRSQICIVKSIISNEVKIEKVVVK